MCDPTVLRRSFDLDKLSRKQIELILEENSNITEQSLIDRHEQFLKDQ
jgi:hypothetical protein